MSMARADSSDTAIPRFLDAASEETRARRSPSGWASRTSTSGPSASTPSSSGRSRSSGCSASSSSPSTRENGTLSVVMADPTDVVKLDELEALLGAA